MNVLILDDHPIQDVSSLHESHLSWTDHIVGHRIEPIRDYFGKIKIEVDTVAFIASSIQPP
jgi:hypothetical protein